MTRPGNSKITINETISLLRTVPGFNVHFTLGRDAVDVAFMQDIPFAS